MVQKDQKCYSFTISNLYNKKREEQKNLIYSMIFIDGNCKLGCVGYVVYPPLFVLPPLMSLYINLCVLGTLCSLILPIMILTSAAASSFSLTLSPTFSRKARPSSAFSNLSSTTMAIWTRERGFILLSKSAMKPLYREISLSPS